MKSPLRKSQEKADKKWQEVCMGNNPKCEICGKTAHCCHHFFAKSVASSLRYDLENGIKICVGCHFRLHNSGDPEYEEIIKKKRGGKWLNYLREKRKQLIKPSIKYYQGIIDNLCQIS